MGDFIQTTVAPHFNFWIYVILMMIGLWALMAKNNLIKKLIGMSIFQTAIILFYVSLGVKTGSTIPILDHHGPEHHETAAAGETKGERKDGDHAKGGPVKEEGHHDEHHVSPDPDTIANPLPHVLMLTAIVVGVSTLGVALAVAQMIFKEFGTLEENEILEQIKAGNVDD